MNAFTSNIARIVMVSALIAGMAVKAEQAEPATPPAVVVEAKAESGTVLDTIKTELLQDLQLQLTDSITQQASSALSHVVQSVKAMLP